MSRPPEFDLTRGIFWLVAFVVACSLLSSLAMAGACVWGNFGEKVLECKKFELRDFIGDLLGVIVLLLYYANGRPPPPDGAGK